MSFEKFREDCKKALIDYDKDPVIEMPPKDINADLAYPCFSLAKQLHKSPVDIAKDISSKIKPHGLLSKIYASGPYVNFFLNNEKFSEEVVKNALSTFKSAKKSKTKIMTEFCHANTHKAFHIGHTRNICLGEAMSRVLEEQGMNVIRVNYQGDIGMHVAKTLWGMMNLKKLGLKEPAKDKGKWLGIVYAASSAAAKDEKIAEDVNKINQLLYSGDKKLIGLWKKTRQWSIDYFNRVVYPDFGVKFKRFYFESKVEKSGTKIAQELLKNGIAKMSEGAVVMDFEKDGMGIYIILKSDGTPLYSTKDLALAELQEKEFKPDKILHIVASEQDLYFKQLFETLKRSNPKLAQKEEHLSYELVISPTGKMSSREGKVILYDDTLATLVSLVKEEIKKREIKLSSAALEKRSKKIALAAVKYAMLSHDPKKTIVFNEKEVTQFEGDTGPYLQYTYARARSILRKSKKKPKVGSLSEVMEFELAKKLSLFASVLEKASKEYKPHYIANYLFELSSIFNEFYHFTKVIGSDNECARLALVQATTNVINKGLYLLGIDAIEEM